MKNLLTRLYHEATWGHLLISRGKWFYNYCRFRLLPEKTLLKRVFKQRLGYELNLVNPRTLNEKIQWLKLNDRTPLHTRCADKYAVRDYIKQKIGEKYLIPLHLKTEDPDDIAPDNLPDAPFVVKTNHNSGGAVIVRDKLEVDWPEVRRQLAELLKTNYYHKTKEWQYKDIRPCIVVEKLLQDEQARLPHDYKFHCFNGRFAFVQVDMDRQSDHKRNIYDRHWALLDCRWLYQNGEDVERPERLDDMISLAELIAHDFRYVRVDFYNLGRDIYFGELTFHPEAGFGWFDPEHWDCEFGSQLDLHN